MARYANDPFPGTNYDDYANWEKVVAPNGAVYYVVPGRPEYVLDIVASNASGRKVFRSNPKLQIQAQQEQEKLQKEAIEQQQFNSSPLGQLLPVGAGTLGMIAAQQFAPKSAADLAAAELIKQQGLQQGIGAATGGAGSLAGSAASGALAPAAPTGVTMGAPTAITPAAPSFLSGLGSVGVLPLAGIAAGTYLGGKAAYDMFKGEKPDTAGRVVLGMATGGLSEVANKFMGHKSTRQEAADKTKDLLKQSDDPTYQNYVSGMREQYKSAPTGKAYAGKYDTWDEYKKAGLEANDLTGVYGNIKTYGPEWANLTEDQRRAVTQANIDSGLYQSKKGDVDITDKNKAIENKNNVLKGFAVATQATPAAPLAQAAAQGAMAIPRPVSPVQNAFVRR